ncbi:MAG: 2-oxo acid dehydrogenase subunit E2 [Anaerolineales bacterium]|nr:2-oxo acid dehydrogenase subunit E2 [Anaerolineales bacterium]
MAEIINMPKLGFDMAEGVLVRWVKQVGDTVAKGDVLAEIETDKATVEVETHSAGTILQLVVEQGAVVPVNAPIAVIGQPGEKADLPTGDGEQKTEAAPQTPTQPTPVSQSAPAAESDSDKVKASPLARKIAKDNAVNLADLQGTGPGGRVVKKDVEAALDGQKTEDRKPSAPVYSPSSFVVSQEDKVIPTTKLRQAIGRRLVESKQTIPHFYVTHEYKMNALMDMRKQINAYLPDNEKVSVNDFIIKAAALTLRQFPNLNATIKGAEIVQFGRVNVGVAVTVPGGLMTVVVKDADVKPLRQISGEIKAMAARARDGKVKPDDVDGSTFSTSNLGMYDVEDFIAIINPPEAAILAISSAREIPVVENSQVKIGWRMKATISVDHRVSDGAEAAQFMQALAEFLENPARVLV